MVNLPEVLPYQDTSTLYVWRAVKEYASNHVRVDRTGKVTPQYEFDLAMSPPEFQQVVIQHEGSQTACRLIDETGLTMEM